MMPTGKQMKLKVCIFLKKGFTEKLNEILSDLHGSETYIRECFASTLLMNIDLTCVPI